MRKNLCFVLFVLCSGKALAQERDFFSSRYTFVPSGVNQVDFNQSRTQVNFPIKTSFGLLRSSLRFDYYRFNYDSNLFSQMQSLQRMYAANLNISHARDISDNWKIGLGFLLGTQSNFQSQLSGEDFNLGGSLFLVKTSSANQSMSRLVVGINFSNALGEPRLLPMIGYTRIYKSGSAFALGFPNTFYKHQINPRNSIKALVDIQGFYTNISDNPNFGESTIDRAFFLSAAFGLEYKHKVDENWGVLFKTSYSFLNDYTLLDEAENEIFDFDLAQVMYLSVGITYNIDRKQNNLR